MNWKVSLAIYRETKIFASCWIKSKELEILPQIKPASHWPSIKESEGPQSVVRSDEICSDYFPPIVSIPLPDRQTKSHICNRKLPPIVGPKSDMTDYSRLTPIIIFLRRKFSHCPIFHPTLRSVGQWDTRLSKLFFGLSSVVQDRPVLDRTTCILSVP